LLVDYIDLLREAIKRTRVGFPFAINAIGILPGRIHAVWTLASGDSDFSYADG